MNTGDGALPDRIFGDRFAIDAAVGRDGLVDLIGFPRELERTHGGHGTGHRLLHTARQRAGGARDSQPCCSHREADPGSGDRAQSATPGTAFRRRRQFVTFVGKAVAEHSRQSGRRSWWRPFQDEVDVVDEGSQWLLRISVASTDDQRLEGSVVSVAASEHLVSVIVQWGQRGTPSAAADAIYSGGAPNRPIGHCAY